MQKTVPLETKRSLAVSQASPGCASSISSGGSIRKSMMAANPMQLSRRQPIVAAE